MSQIQRQPTPLPLGAAIPEGSLRADMERRRAAGERYSLGEAVAIVVPLCTELALRHADGQRLFVHPSSIVLEQGTLGTRIDDMLAISAPLLPRDKACMAPEERKGEPGDARASVFTVGAILYELLTGEHVGPGMRRPSEAAPGLPDAVEVVLGKALVADPGHRPDDLAALAQALHHLQPDASIAPPAADESHLDHGAGFDVDVSLSMLPPAAAAPVVVPTYAMPSLAKASAPPRAGADPTAKLSDLKARLESDPRPRYVVVKDGMDHGPFSAVELLQQIASHTFEENHVLRDAFSGDDRPIADWEEFAPFAEQAKLNREIVAEKKEIERASVAEAKGTRTKTFVGVGLVAVVVIGAGAFVAMKRGAKDDTIAVARDEGINIETDGGLKSQARAARGPGGSGGPGAGAGGVPQLAGGMSCEAARAKYVEEINLGGGNGAADLTSGQFGSVLNNGSYVTACGTPASMKVRVCAAVQNGRAVGVTVTTDPPNAGVASCIAGRVRGLGFPSNPKLDIATTVFQ